MSTNEYLRLAHRYRDSMKVLEEKYTLEGIKRHPEGYVQCLECKIHYHTYKGLYWETRAKEPKAVPGKALRIRDSHYKKREVILEELAHYKRHHGLR